MSDNLALWQSVEKTPVEHTKPITGKSYKGNSPKPHHIVKRVTETFGPIGIGWGFDIVDEGLHEGAEYADGQCEKMHFAKVRVWYLWNNQRGEVEHVGGTIFSGRRKDANGVPGGGAPFTDDDAPKKSITDALIKALSLIGFAGDIFLGRYDDSKYMAELQTEAREAKKAAAASDTPQSPPDRRQPPKSPPKAPTQPNGNGARPVASGEPSRAPLDDQGDDIPPDMGDPLVPLRGPLGGVKEARLSKAVEWIKGKHADTSIEHGDWWEKYYQPNIGWLERHMPKLASELSVRGE